MGWLRASQWLMLLWITASQFDDITAQNFCDKTLNIRKDVTSSCSLLTMYAIQGYNIDRQKSNLTQYNDTQLSLLLMQYTSKPQTSPLCSYFRYESKNVSECCGGWVGDNCDEPICDPPCANSGECVAPGFCDCQEPFAGISCLENKTAVSSTEKYCYADHACTGVKANNQTDVLTKDDCCLTNRGKGWGLYGDSCESCPNSLPSGDNSDYVPDRPHVVQEKFHLPFKTCLGTGPNYYRTFDGLEFLHSGRCTYMVYDNKVTSITVQKNGCQYYSTCNCLYRLTFDSVDTVVVDGSNITSNGVPVEITETRGFASSSGNVQMYMKGEIFFIQYGLLLFTSNRYVTCDWTLTSQRQPRPINSSALTGICGNMDGIPENDLTNRYGQSVEPWVYVNSLSVYDHNNPKCPDAGPFTSPCNSTTYAEATKACSVMKYSPFSYCHKTVYVKSYYSRCIWNYCAASLVTDPVLRATEQNTVLCNALSDYTQLCLKRGVSGELNWRTKTFCPKTCPYKLEYSDCLTSCLATCSNMFTVQRLANENTDCYPGCRCPVGKVLDDDGVCKAPEECPCVFHKTKYGPGSSISTNCNNCTCKNGQWLCSAEICSKTCSVYGAGHIDTFDGKEYSYYGKVGCTYTAVETRSDKTNDQETHIRSVSYKIKSCPTDDSVSSGQGCGIELVTIDYQDKGVAYQITISRNPSSGAPVVKRGNVELTSQNGDPIVVDCFAIRRSSSSIVLYAPGGIISFQNGALLVRLDRIYTAKIQGLCGNMDGSVDNEYTSRNQIQESLPAFASSFSDCQDNVYTDIDACKFNNKAIYLTERCNPLFSNFSLLFGSCSLPSGKLRSRYDACVQDVCRMDEGVSTVCSSYALLGKMCAEQGVKVNWIPQMQDLCFREDVYSCNQTTQFSLTYQTCPPAKTTCRDLSRGSFLTEKEGVCMPGCACGEGYLLNDQRQCVQISSCTCVDNYNVVHGPGESVRQGCQNCTCTNGTWQCGEKNCKTTFTCAFNQEYLLSRPKCNSTCANYGQRCDSSEEITEQCGCKPPLVLDDNGNCVNPDECPCSFNGKLHPPGATLTDGCNNCVCMARDWECTRDDERCKGVCTASGDPHYRTYDGLWFDHNGDCEYILSESITPGFQITASNIPCGAAGKTCTKDVKIKLDNGNVIRLVAGSQPQYNDMTVDPYARLDFPEGSISQNGMMTLVSLDRGVSVLWNGGESVSIYLTRYWFGKVQGFCGNYDGNSDDFLQPNAGLGTSFSNERDLANAFKTQPCTETVPSGSIDPCQDNINRKKWAEQNCAIISQGDTFKECREKDVNYQLFEKNCRSDACRCDSGGDCECLCSAIADFAAACLRVGICVDWRSQHFCPVMCPRGMEYRVCDTPCERTCGFLDNRAECNNYTVEGCYCPEGKVLNRHGICVDIDQCDCVDPKGRRIPAGTVLEIDCQTCECVNGTLNCTGPACEPECPEDQVRCELEKKCINASHICDHIPDCIYNSDEQNCTYACKQGEFPCTTRECIPESYKCDDKIDCPDGSDEAGCTLCDDKFWIICDHGACVHKSFLCDGEYDCSDRTDEMNCTECFEDAHHCTTTMLCRPHTVRCDGVDDCGDGSDEEGCDLFTPPPELCSEDADLYDLKFENQGDFRIVIGDQSVQNYDRNARILLGSPDNLTILVAATENVLYIVRQLQNSSSVPDGSTYTFVHLQFSGVHVQNSRIELIDSKGESVYSTESPDSEDTDVASIVKFEANAKIGDVKEVKLTLKPVDGETDIAIGELFLRVCMNISVTTVATTSGTLPMTAIATTTVTPPVSSQTTPSTVSAATTTSVITASVASATATPSIVTPGIPSTTASPATTSVVPPCVIEDILARPDAVQFIDSTNPEDNKNLRTDDNGEKWTSKEPAAISVNLPPGTQVMGVYVTGVNRTDGAIITLVQNGSPVEKAEEVPKEGVIAANFSGRPAEKVFIQFVPTNDTDTQISVTGLNIYVCGVPVSTTIPPFEKSTTPQVVSTSLQPVVSTTTPKEGTPISEVSGSTAQPTTPPTPGTVESTTGKVLQETTPAAPGTTQPATTTSVVEITSEQTAPTPAPETTQPPVVTASVASATSTPSIVSPGIPSTTASPATTSVVPPCVVEDILTRPDAVQFIDSTNPQDNKNLRPDDGGKTWTSKEPASISVDLTPGTRVMGVTLTEVTGTDRAIITVFQNNAPVEETQEVPKEGVIKANFSGVPGDKVVVKFVPTNNIDAETSVEGLNIYVCGVPVSTTIPPFEKSTTPQLVSTSLQPVVSTTTPKEGTPISEVSGSTAQPTTPPTPGTVESTTGKVLQETTPAAPGTTQPATTTSVVEITSVQTAPTPAPETTQPPVVTASVASATATPSIVSPGIPSTTSSLATTSVVPPCVVEDILTRPDAVQFIDSTNPQDNKNLRPDDGGKTWTSKEPASISVDLTPGTRVMGVTLTEVTGTDRAIITVFQNNAPVEETQEVPKEGVIKANFSGVPGDKVVVKFVPTNNIDAETSVEGLNIYVCGVPVSTTIPPFEKSTTPQVVSTSLQPVVSTTTPKEGTPISEVSGSTAQPTTPPTPGTVESTTGKVLQETTPAAPGTTQPATTTSVVEITSVQTAPTPAPETTQPPVASTTSPLVTVPQTSFFIPPRRTTISAGQCQEQEDLMARPNAEKFIDSTNPPDNVNLLPGNDKSWTSPPEAYVVITPETQVQVVSIEVSKVTGASDVYFILMNNGSTVAEVERNANKNPVQVASPSWPTWIDKIIVKFASTDENVTDVTVDNIKVMICGTPVSASTPPFEKSTTPQVVSTSLQPVVSTTTPKEGTPISEVSVSTAQPTTPLTPGTVESTTGKVLGETTPAAPGTTPASTQPGSPTPGSSTAPTSQTTTAPIVKPTTTVAGEETTTKPGTTTPSGLRTTAGTTQLGVEATTLSLVVKTTPKAGATSTPTVHTATITSEVKSTSAQTTSVPLVTASISIVSISRIPTTIQIRTTPPISYVCSAYNLTRIGEVMWIEKDGIFGPNLSEEKVFPDDEVEPDVTVIVDYCTECTCAKDVGFRCEQSTRELPRTAFEKPYPPCFKEQCGEHGIEVINMTASCQCAENETLTREKPPTCCTCIPSPSSVPTTTSIKPPTQPVVPTTPPVVSSTTQPAVVSTTQSAAISTPKSTAPPGPCQLIKESGTLRLDDADGNVCESETVVITSCKGSCASWDKSTVMFVDKPDDIQHPKDCQCCQGFGDWVLHNVTCAEKVRSVKILQFDECRCSECESSPPPTDPNGGNESPDGPTSDEAPPPLLIRPNPNPTVKESTPPSSQSSETNSDDKQSNEPKAPDFSGERLGIGRPSDDDRQLA